MSGYNLRLAGLTIAGSRTHAEADIAAVFGPGVAYFSAAVGPISEDVVTHWMVATKTRDVVLPYYIDITRKTHETTGTEEVLEGLSQKITRDGLLLGAWAIYEDQRPGGFRSSFGAWLASLGLERKERTIDGASAIDTIIDTAIAAEGS